LRRTEENGLVTYRFDRLAVEGVTHAVFTRLGGVSQGPFSSLNVGHTVGDDAEAVRENHRRIYASLGIDGRVVASPHQVHGNRVAAVSARDAGQVLKNTDGLVTRTPGLALLLRFADCQPVVLYDPAHHAAGLLHAGWRGVAQGIVRRGVEAMAEAFGSRPRDLLAGLGPAIGPCCYTVGHEVAAAMGYALPDWREVMKLVGDDQWSLDLSAANAQQLAAAGVARIEQAHLCTACRSDEFFSHRAENGHTGRFAAVVVLEPRAEETETEDAGGTATGEAGLESLQPPGMPSFGEITGGEM
jgi:YfiH family protein